MEQGTVLLAGFSALAAGCFLISITTHPVAFFLSFAGVAAIGFGLIATHVVSTAVEQEFDENQGLATGIATSGSTGGQFMIIPLLAILLSYYNWRIAFVVMGIATIVMMICVLRWFPKGSRFLPDKAGEYTAQTSAWQDVWAISKLPTFQILFWSYFICGYTTTGVIETHFLPYASFCGFGPVSSATAYGVLSGVNLIGMIAAGWLTDRMNRPLLLGGIYVLRGLTFILLVSVRYQTSRYCLSSPSCFGLMDYSTVPVTASLIASHVGLRVMGLAFGLVSAGHAVGAALGAYSAGVLFDIYQQYDWVWWSSLWLAVLAGIMVFFLSEKRGMANV